MNGNEKTRKLTVRGRARSAAEIVASAGMAAALALAPAGSALGVEPSAGAQTGTGDTDVYVQLKDIGEHSGTNDPTNPDDDNPPDGLGDQIAFTVPSEINFVADAKGVLTGPSAAATYIENRSVFGIHGSSLKVEAQGGWTLVEKDAAATAANSVSFQVGPEGDMLDAAKYTTKAAMTDKTKWQMTAAVDEGTDDRVQMKSAGKISNVSQDLTEKKKVAVMHWYVTPGPAPSA